MTNEKAVELLLEKRRELQSFVDVTPKPEETYPHMVAFCEALDVAAAALREKAERENPRPLTLEELRQMHGEPVYVSDLQRPGGSEYCIIHAKDKYGHGDKYRSAQIGGCECFWYNFEDYGERWIAYRHKPKEAGA